MGELAVSEELVEPEPRRRRRLEMGELPMAVADGVELVEPEPKRRRRLEMGELPMGVADGVEWGIGKD
jgi:hypothetical protein